MYIDMYMYMYMYMHVYTLVDGVSMCTVRAVQTCLIVARLWSCSSEQVAADDVNQYLGWTIAQLSSKVCFETHPLYYINDMQYTFMLFSV